MMDRNSIEFELWIANAYKRKVESATAKGIEFKLNLVSFRNLMRTKKCPYTDKTLTIPEPNNNGKLRATDITIDRIDNKLGYVPGNVMAISHQANNLKSRFENDGYFSLEEAYKIIGKMIKYVSKQ